MSKKNISTNEKLEILETLVNLAKKLNEATKNISQDHSDCDDDCNEDIDEDDEDESNLNEYKKNAKFLNKRYKEILVWAFGSKGRYSPNEINAQWKKLHPDLPPILLSPYFTDDVQPTVLIMQIAPHWYNATQK